VTFKDRMYNIGMKHNQNVKTTIKTKQIIKTTTMGRRPTAICQITKQEQYGHYRFSATSLHLRPQPQDQDRNYKTSIPPTNTSAPRPTQSSVYTKKHTADLTDYSPAVKL